MGTPNSTFSTTPQPTNSYTGSTLSNPTLALNTNQNKNAGLFQQPKQNNILAGFSTSNGSSAQSTGLANSSGVINTPVIHPGLVPSTPVKTITDSGGNKIDFHPPKVVAPDDPANQYNTATGAKNPNYKDPNAPKDNTQNNQQNNQQNNNGVFTGATTALAGMGNQPGQAYQSATDKYNQTAEQLAGLESGQAQRTAALNTAGKGMPWATGTENQLNIATAGQEQALAGQLGAESNVIGAANTQQGLQQGALGTAAGLAQPTQVSPGNTLVSTTSTQPLYGLGTGAGGNGGNAYQNFANLQFNTTAGNQYAQQANNLTTASNQIDQNFQTLNGVAQKYGMNLTNLPTLNTAQQFIMQHGGNAGAVASFNEAMNALQTSIGQIINNSGAFTPTEISSLANQMSAAALSPSQMQQLYNTVKQTAATKINTIQTQALNAEKAGTNFNNGSPASPNPINLGGSTGTFDY